MTQHLQDCQLTQNSTPDQLLVCAARMGSMVDVITCIESLEADVNARIREETAIGCAVKASNVCMTEYLLSQNADIIITANKCITHQQLIDQVFLIGHTKIMKMFLLQEAVVVGDNTARVENTVRLLEAINMQSFVRVKLFLTTTEYSRTDIKGFLRHCTEQGVPADIYNVVKLSYDLAKGSQDNMRKERDLSKQAANSFNIESTIWKQMNAECGLKPEASKEAYLACAVNHEHPSWVKKEILRKAPTPIWKHRKDALHYILLDSGRVYKQSNCC